MATYLTGDIHGYMDERFDAVVLASAGIRPTCEDVLVILGDAGFLWDTSIDDYPDYFAYEDVWLIGHMLAAWPGDVAFLDGNHEHFPLLEQLPTQERWGAPVGVVQEHLYHLRRGELYHLSAGPGADTASCFVMGGAYSVDKSWRTEGVDWWPEEIPSEAEIDHGKATLERAGWSVDYLLTHDCAPWMVAALTRGNPFGHIERHDRLTDFLAELDGRASFSHWYCGHHHVTRTVDELHTCLYDTVVPLGFGEEG